MMPDRTYESAETSFAKDDLFCLLTDGLTEVFDKADRELGLDGVAAVLAAQAREPLASIEQHILDAARAQGPQLDDQSLILIRAE